MDENTNGQWNEEENTQGTGQSGDAAQQETGSAYTGEYGETVKGEYQNPNQSVYRYSYRDGDAQSTHSGDYYAGKNTQQETGDNSTGSEDSSTYQNNSYNQSAQNNTYNQGCRNTGSSYQNGDYQNTGSSYQNGGYQNNGSFYQNGGYQNNGYQQEASSDSGKKKGGRWLPSGKKLCITAICAVVFGLLGGVCFNAVNYVVGKTTDSGTTQSSSSTTLDQTTVGSSSEDSESSDSTDTGDVAAIAEQCMPAVVAITSTTEGEEYYSIFGQYYQGEDTTSSGSGFIVGQNDEELLIATNNHVIDGADSITVQFIDDEIYDAETKGTDSSNDLAVVAVKIEDIKESTMEQIKIADMGDSDDLQVGEMVIAIGNALGYGQSVTVGYVSAKDREITTESSDSGETTTITTIQTDAAINPGNSGGALLNMQGQVIGINSAKIASSDVEGIGYAIPISVATPIIDELMNRETLSDEEKGYLGISGMTVTDEAVTYNIPYGVYVNEVAEGGAAEEAGIKSGDVITAVDKMEVTTIESLQEKINSYRKGTEVEITLQRNNGGTYEEKKVTVTLQGSESLDSLTSGSTSGDNAEDDVSSEEREEKGNGSDSRDGFEN